MEISRGTSVREKSEIKTCLPMIPIAIFAKFEIKKSIIIKEKLKEKSMCIIRVQL